MLDNFRKAQRGSLGTLLGINACFSGAHQGTEQVIMIMKKENAINHVFPENLLHLFIWACCVCE